MIEKNFQFLSTVKIKTVKSFSCETSGCNDAAECRCCKINSAQVESVNIPQMSFLIWEAYHTGLDTRQADRDKVLAKLFYGGLDIDIYCIDRVLTKLGVWNPKKNSNRWTVSVREGYYGEEVDGAYLGLDCIKEINKHVSRILGYDSLKEKLEYCLMLEYSRVLDILSDKDYEINEINFGEIQFSETNRNHIELVSNQDLDHYSPENYDDLPRGIVKQVGSKFYIIDGFHRILSMKDRPMEEFKVFTVIG